MKKIVLLVVVVLSVCFLQGCTSKVENSKISESQKYADSIELEELGFFDPLYFDNEYREGQAFEIFYVKAGQDANSSFYVFKNYRGEWCYDPYVERYTLNFDKIIAGVEPNQYEKIWLLGEYDFASAIAIQVSDPFIFNEKGHEWIDIDDHRCIIAYFKPSTVGPDFGSWELHSPALPGANLMSGMLTREASRQKFEQLAAELRTKGTLAGVDASDDIIGLYGAGSWILSDY